MAELAAGAVHSLLGVIRDEAHLLGRVETDVQFIKEEMESMSSFLLHLSSTAPPGGADEHGEQVRTWMKQVRELAHDCNNSIDRYLQRGNPALYRAGRGPLGLNYVFWWVPWYLQKLTAQHIAAIELRELKDRARDVGKRRLRYDVQIPKPTTTATNGSTSTPSSSQVIPHDEEDEDEDDGPNIHDRLARRELIFAEPCTKEECRAELVEWLRKAKVADDEDQLKSIPIAASNQEKGTSTANGLRTIPIAESNQGEGSKMRSIAGQEGFRAIAIVAPEQEEGVDVASAAIFADEAKFDCKFTINVFTGPEMMPTGLPAGAFDILEPIMNQFGIGQVKEEEDAQTKRQAEIHEVNEAQQQPKMRDIDQKIDKIKAKIKKHLHTTSTTMSIDNVPLLEVEPLDILLHGIQEQPWVQVVNTDLSKDQMKTKKIEETAKKIKEHMESRSSPVGLDHQEYVNILQKRLGRTNEEATDKSDDEISKSIKEIKLKIKSVEEATDKLGDEQIAKKIKETAEKIIMVNKLEELLLKPTETDKLEEKRKKKGTNKQHAESQMLENKITATTNAVLQDIKKKLQSKMAEKIKEYLAGKKTLILLIGMDYSYKWAEIIKALSSLGCAPGSAVVVTTRYTHGADEFCNPPGEQPILCYLAASYYKKVLEIMMKQPINYNTSIFRDILERCEPHQFSMKIFAHAMFANPRRKKEELDKLLETLAPRGSLDKTNDKKMIKFSYNDLPKDFKTCLLYLAIFQPKDDKKPEAILQPKDDRKPEAILQPKDDRKPEKEYDTINRSRLVGRWVVEGMITKQDWSSSVLQAERCFDALVDRHLICPHNIGATGKVKSCTVDATVHEFITKVAKKRHIVEARLSHHLAKHFSVLSDVRLRSSDNMKKFFKKLDVSPQLPLVKVLDLQGCQDWDKNCLRHICSKMLLLKYLSLRDTGITELPHQINNLHQLEVLDIRQKGNIVTASTTTRDVLLLKLKRLLAGSSTPTNTQNVRIPRGIAKMTNLEVLSRVKASSSRAGRDLKDIGRLWQLRKLGVVLDDDRPGHLTYLLEAIGDLSESLRSLSITLTCSKGDPDYSRDMAENIAENYSKNPPKFLESLSIDGYTCKGQLLPWLLKDNNLPALAKVTLCNTFLKEGNMEHLAELDNLCCLRLMCGAYTDSRLSFLCAKFKKLKYLLVECGKPDEISFDVGAAPELSKIVLSFTSMEESLSPSLSGISNLKKLKELEFNRDEIPSQVMQDIANHPNKNNLALKRIKARQAQEASAYAAAP